MSKTERIIKISLITLFIIFFSYYVASAQSTSLNQDDSIYKYNALENKINFSNSTNNADYLGEKLSENDTAINDNIKKLKDITEQQNNSIEKSEDNITAIENRSALRTFLIGNKLGILKFEMVQMKDQNYALNTLALNTLDNIVKNQINNQMNTSKQQQKKVENFILKQKDKFSLFGWLVSSL